MGLLEAVKRVCETEQLLHPGERVVVAVSGGPDSIALLHLLHRLARKWQLKLVAAHVDHRFRGEQSAREAEQVRRFAELLGVPCESTRIDLPRHIALTNENAQAAARNKRYAYLRQVAANVDAHAIALGHHADDQAETVMMRIVQGTGPAGLMGMPIRRREGRFRLIRPLLKLSKANLLDYCRQHGLAYATDPSNEMPIYLRNRMRMEVLPYLGQINPQISAALLRLSELAAAEHDFMEERAEETYAGIVHRDGDGMQFDRNSFLSLHLALQRRLITLILKYLSPEKPPYDHDKVEAIREAICRNIPPSSKLDIGMGLQFVREYDRIRIGLNDPSDAKTNYVYPLEHPPSERVVPEAKMVFRLQLTTPQAVTEQRGLSFDDSLMLDYDQVAFPLFVRSRRPGDRMRIKGLNGSKKVKDIFIDAKLPPSVRRSIPLLTDCRGEILWIPGVRRSDHARITGATKRILHIICTPFIT